MTETEINKLTEDTLNSIGESKKHFPDDELFRKIMIRMNENENSLLKSENGNFRLAFVFAILILINIISIYSYKISKTDNTGSNSNRNSETINAFAREFFSGPDEYNYSK